VGHLELDWWMACQACSGLSTGRALEPYPFQGFHLFALRLPTPVGAMFLAGHKLPLGFLLAGRLRLPHAHHPKLQGITSRGGACLGGEQVHASPTELHLGASGSSFVLTGDLDAALPLGWPGFRPVEQMIQEEGAHLQTALQKGKHLGIAVCHMDPHLCLRRGAHLLHRSRPHLACPWSLLYLSAALFAALGLARTRLCHP